MEIDAVLIDRLSWLARIDIEPSEKTQLQQDINAILQLVDQLQAVDTEGVEPMAHPMDLSQPVREDTVTEGDVRADFQPLAPAEEQGLYLVPRVVE